MTELSRFIAIAMFVLGLHVAGAWALNSGLRARADDLLVPVQMLAELVASAKPITQAPLTPVQPAPGPPPTPPAPAKVVPRKLPAKPVVTPEPTPAPELAALPAALAPAVDRKPAATAPTARRGDGPAPIDAPSAAPVSVAATTVAAVSAPAPSAPRTLELPSSDAQYLDNPKPHYPPISHRLGEQGTVLIRVLVSDNGLPQQAQIKTTSGFFRLDSAALSTVLGWRFVPGKRAGVPQPMWVTVPVTFGIQ